MTTIAEDALKAVPDRYREQGGTKPIVFTEFGPPGTWEILGWLTQETSPGHARAGPLPVPPPSFQGLSARKTPRSIPGLPAVW